MAHRNPGPGRPPKYGTEITRPICIQVPASMATTLTRLAADKAVSRSELVTALLTQSLLPEAELDLERAKKSAADLKSGFQEEIVAGNFTTPQMADICGVPQRKILSFIERGYLTPSVQEAAGPGTRRLWSYEDISRCVIIKILSEMLSVETLRFVSKFLMTRE